MLTHLNAFVGFVNYADRCGVKVVLSLHLKAPKARILSLPFLMQPNRIHFIKSSEVMSQSKLMINMPILH